MAKHNIPRVFIMLECIDCKGNFSQRSNGVSRYQTSKNRRNTPEKLELTKHCRFCNRHVLHKEIK